MRFLVCLVIFPAVAFAGDAALDCAFLTSNANCVKPATVELQSCAPPKGEVGKLAVQSKKSPGSGSCAFSNGVTVSWTRTKAGLAMTFAKDGATCATYERTRSTKPADDTLKLTTKSGPVSWKLYDEPKSQGEACTSSCQQSLTCPNGQRYVAPRPFPLGQAECMGELTAFSGDFEATDKNASLTLSGSDDPLFECDVEGAAVAANTEDGGAPEIGIYTGSFSNAQAKIPEMKTRQEGDKIRVKQDGQDVGYIKVEPDQAGATP